MATEIYGIYRGLVENNIDPYGLNRLKVRIPQFYGTGIKGNGYSTDNLPWAKPASPLITSPSIPIGAIVYIMFEQGNTEYPIYIGYMLKNFSNSQCKKCSRYYGGIYCESFPDGIPEEILINEFIHYRPYNTSGKSELLFKQKPTSGNLIKNIL